MCWISFPCPTSVPSSTPLNSHIETLELFTCRIPRIITGQPTRISPRTYPDFPRTFFAISDQDQSLSGHLPRIISRCLFAPELRIETHSGRDCWLETLSPHRNCTSCNHTDSVSNYRDFQAISRYWTFLPFWPFESKDYKF